MKHLFLMLLALPLAFVACEESTSVDVVKDATVKVVAGEATESSLSFTVTTEFAESAAWLVLDAAEATPTASEVLANGTAVEVNKAVECKAEALKADTEYKVVAAVKNSKGVAIAEAVGKTLKAGEEPTPGPEYIYDEEFPRARRYAADEMEYDIPDNYFFIVFADNFTIPSHTLVLTLVGAEEDTVLKAGSYTVADGTIVSEDTGYIVVDGELIYAVSADSERSVCVVEGDEYGYNFDITLETEDGELMHFTFDGVVENMVLSDPNPEPEPEPTPGENVNFTASNFYYEYWGTEYSSAHNYYVVLSDVPMNGDTFSQNSTNYVFDLYSNTGATQAKGVIPNGTYSLSNTYGAGTFSEDYGFLARIYDEVEYVLYVDGFVTVTDGKIEAQLEMEDGTIHTVVYEGDLSWGGNDEPREFEATHIADKWVWAGNSNYGNRYSVVGEGFSVDVHFPAQFAQQEAITANTYTWVTTTVFGYVDFENYFTTRSFTVDGSTMPVDAGEIYVTAEGDEYHIELTLEGRYGTTYMIQYDGKLNNTGSSDATDGDIVLTSATYKEYNGSYGFFTYTLTGEGVSMELLVNETSALQYDIASGTYSYAPMKSLVGNPGYFYVDKFYVDDVKETPQINATLEVVSDGSTVELTMTLPCSSGETYTCTFSGSIQ